MLLQSDISYPPVPKSQQEQKQLLPKTDGEAHWTGVGPQPGLGEEHALGGVMAQHGLPTSSEGAKRYDSHMPDVRSQGNAST
jgi:hypothetical protein